jgi:DNA mismatch repair ATPase MutS
VKSLLLHRDRDFDLEASAPPGAQEVAQDLELDVLCQAMAAGDAFLLSVARKAVFSRLTEVPEVLYRQDVLRDCIANPGIVRGLYRLAVEAVEREKKEYWGLVSCNPGFLLRRSVAVLSMFVEMLRRLRHAAETQAARFTSDGFATLFTTLRKELDDEYLATVEGHLARLKFRRGVLISAQLGAGNVSTGYALRKPNDDGRPWLRRLFARGEAAYTFHIHERDEAGAQAVSQLRDRGINIVANAAAQANDHILSFFRMLRTELAFYVGCLNLHDRLSAKGAPVCFPLPAPWAERRFAVRGLYDVCLALKLDHPVVGNDVDADDTDLVMITGANQGGKSTFLRSVGLAQSMMQSGMFVPARAYHANLATGLYTHYKREEDATMRAGKFEEELERISAIVDHLTPNSIVLFNEAFQSTNEREGSEIGRQIVTALLESRVKVFFVTHIYDLARSLRDAGVRNALFLRAERLEDGTRTFRVIPGAPLPTSHGRDLYEQIFLGAPDAQADAGEGTGPKAKVAQDGRNEIARAK